MGMCKGCSEVYSALEMKDGLCKECIKNGVVIEEPKQKKKEQSFLKKLGLIFVYIGISWGVFVFVFNANTTATTLKQETKPNTVNCSELNRDIKHQEKNVKTTRGEQYSSMLYLEKQCNSTSECIKLREKQEEFFMQKLEKLKAKYDSSCKINKN